MKRLLLIMNPRAGIRRANRYLPEVLMLFERRGYAPITWVTLECGDARRVAAERAAEADLVVCIGGDGTLNEVADGMIACGATTPLGYIAAGSTNDFAASMRLNRDILKAAETTLSGEPRKLDAIAFNGRHYTYVASCGAFTDVCYTTPQASKNALGRLAYFLNGVRDVGLIKPIPMRIKTQEGRLFEGDYILTTFSNGTSIAGLLHIDASRVDMNDGLFEVLLIRAPRTMQEVASILQSLTARTYNAEMLAFFTSRRVEIEMSPDVDWTLDGEYARGAEKIVIENVPGALTLMAPAQKPAKNLLRG